jgi:hypothetical protein
VRIADLLRDEVAGDPMSGLRWTRKTTENIAEQLLGLGIEISANTVARLSNEMGFSLKTNRKNIESGIQHKPGHHARRNRQFLTIKSTRHQFERAKQPVISVDGKKREMIGLFKNNGRTWREKPKQVNDYDFRTDAIDVALPAAAMYSRFPARAAELPRASCGRPRVRYAVGLRERSGLRKCLLEP